ncbi:putative ADP-ribosylation factor GTPase-activating protein agd15-like [Cymbomonas tetramitiformis]|uniref:ADP-ribosylation factor GTPase-activating protein agd15-like n=1 Tax=Cymbomonas tetramitiformis TaxID=36881 RepID=A0AAE0LBK8_9CHLO|nr:putative ADP-ribosylation factor GTPase-activating protein agd15-like [Cymbomonas tetramitiformis]
MDDITWDKYTFSQWLRDYLTALSSGRIRPFTYVERLARAATRNEPWGPHGCLLTAVAKASHRREDCEIVFLVLKKRFRVEPARWRNIYKSLGLIEFVATRGSDHAVKCSEDLLSTISGLKTFQYKDKSGKDEGLNVRHKAKAVEALLLDKSNLDVLRSRAVKAYWGVGADDTLPDLGDELSDEEQFAEGDIPGEGMEWSPSSSFASSSSSVAPSKQPQAGQTKGVTKEIEAKNRRALALLLKRPENRCIPHLLHTPLRRRTSAGACPALRFGPRRPGACPALRFGPRRPGPTASTSGDAHSAACGGLFVQKLRRLFHSQPSVGLHQLRHLHLHAVCGHSSRPGSACVQSPLHDSDVWLPEQVAFMAFTGNKLANGHYESASPEGFCRPISGNVEGKPTAELNAFVRDKYNNRFVAPGSEWPPPPPAEITEALAAAPPLLMTSSNSSSLKDLRKVINMNDLQPAKSRSSSAGSLKAPATPPAAPLPDLMDLSTPEPEEPPKCVPPGLEDWGVFESAAPTPAAGSSPPMFSDTTFTRSTTNPFASSSLPRPSAYGNSKRLSPTTATAATKEDAKPPIPLPLQPQQSFNSPPRDLLDMTQGDPEVHPTRGSTEDTVQMLSAELGMLSPPSSSAPHGEVQLDPGMRPINQEKVEPDFFAQLVHQRTSENGAEKAAAPFTASDVATPSTAAFDLFGDLEIDAQTASQACSPTDGRAAISSGQVHASSREPLLLL